MKLTIYILLSLIFVVSCKSSQHESNVEPINERNTAVGSDAVEQKFEQEKQAKSSTEGINKLSIDNYLTRLYFKECGYQCPSFVVQFDQYGEAKFIGKQHVNVKEERAFTLSNSDIKTLNATVAKAFHPKLCRGQYSDFSELEVSLALPSGIKTERLNSGCHNELFKKIESLVLVHVERWVSGRSFQ